VKNDQLTRDVAGHRRQIRREEIRFLTIAEVAQWLSVSTRTVHRWIADKNLIAHRFGAAVRIAESEFAAFVAQHRNA
jgi:excisionase family DNA binding protein